MAWRANTQQWKALTQQVQTRDQGICQLCGLSTDGEMNVDHILPRSKGGGDTLDNLRLAHASCNSSRGNGDNYAPIMYARLRGEPVLTPDILSTRGRRALQDMQAGAVLRRISITPERYQIYQSEVPRYRLSKVVAIPLIERQYVTAAVPNLYIITHAGEAALERDVIARQQREASRKTCG